VDGICKTLDDCPFLKKNYQEDKIITRKVYRKYEAVCAYHQPKSICCVDENSVQPTLETNEEITESSSVSSAATENCKFCYL
jgi:hypothetical protein